MASDEAIEIWGITPDDESVLRVWFENKVDFKVKAGKMALVFFAEKTKRPEDERTINKFKAICGMLHLTWRAR